jgi:hypothetical protein
VDVIGFNDKTWMGAGGATLHSDALHVRERYTRVDYDSLRPGKRLHEYECIENNEDIVRFERLLKNESLFRRRP